MIHIATQDAASFIADDGSRVRELLGRTCGRPSGRNGAAYSIAHISLGPCATGTPHFHRDGDEIYVVLSGAGNMVVDGTSTSVKAGDVVLLEPNEVHSLVTGPEEGIEFLAFSVPAFSPEDFIRTEATTRSEPDK